MEERTVWAWHFTDGWALCDGTPLEVGRTYEHDGTLVLCDAGYHASRRLIDALGYAPGSVLSRVAVGGEIIEGDDKLVARTRTVLWALDVAPVLHGFACRCAEDALSVAGTPDPRSVAAIAAKRAWLRGEINDEGLAAAGAAAGAAWAAAGAAAGDAAVVRQNRRLTAMVAAYRRTFHA